ncbi:dicarboxylate transporter 1, chloroplastic-like [Gossypium raimondii]|uniref:dicarboxylate transporter 1, chloroplastic-like n=1 Tax=Gossypium raimondii TaxID=29730 RepID=UPI00227AE691|nr:dicarboxylate transporter 1, chloroplastic-like [Gossypium raimondii]XP_052487820.1 dicarboxylate transporter 1, chloroplastic-like [Gossypium raimondii]
MRRLGRANSKTPLLGHSCEKGTIKHSFPMKYVLKPWKLGRWFYQVVKFSIVQYMIIKILAALLAVILEAFELIAMAGYLNKYGLISWFSQTVVKVVGGLGLSWQMSFGILVLLYFYSHYFFASGAAHIGAMFTAFLSVATALGTPSY